MRGKKELYSKNDLFQGIFEKVTPADEIILGHWFMQQNMFVVGSSYRPMAYGQMPGDVLKDEEGVNTMKVLGQNMAYLLKALEEK